jgi:UDPglucose 6-dehydrogenase
MAINAQRKRAMARKVAQACGGSLRDRRVAVLGLTFKPDTDDVRDSPALSLIEALQDGGATVAAYDPKGVAGARVLTSEVEFAENAYEAARGADALVVVTDWDEFRSLELGRLKRLMRRPAIVDLRNLLDPGDAASLGFVHLGVGRGELTPAALQAEAAE